MKSMASKLLERFNHSINENSSDWFKGKPKNSGFYWRVTDTDNDPRLVKVKIVSGNIVVSDSVGREPTICKNPERFNWMYIPKPSLPSSSNWKDME